MASQEFEAFLAEVDRNVTRQDWRELTSLADVDRYFAELLRIANDETRNATERMQAGATFVLYKGREWLGAAGIVEVKASG